LDKLEDPYELYDEELKQDDSEKTLVEVVKEERQNLKKSRRSVWQTTKDSKASFSFYRLGSYLILIFGFFYLNNNQLLEIPIYLVSLAIPSIVIVSVLMRKS
jgi:23S rRNA maturation mini-RNase III